MKISIEQKTLSQALRRAKMIARSNNLPALGCVHIKAEGDGITISGNNLDHQIVITVKADVVQEGEIVLSCERLIAVVDQIKGDVIIKSNDTSAEVSGTGMKAKLYGLPISELPEKKDLDITNAATFQMDGDDLSKAFKRVGVAMADKARPALMCVSLQHKEPGLVFVASDGRRIHILQTDVPITNWEGLDLPASVPGEAIPIMCEICRGSVARMVITDSAVSLTAGDIYYQTKLLELGFPNIWVHIPEISKNTFTVRREELIGAIDRVSAINGGELAKIQSGKDGVMLTAEVSAAGNVESRINAPQASRVEFSINGGYFRDAINAMTSDDVTVENLRSIDPVVMREENFTALIVPIRNS